MKEELWLFMSNHKNILLPKAQCLAAVKIALSNANAYRESYAISEKGEIFSFQRIDNKLVLKQIEL